ncbi:acyl carrier protein [Salinispora mooreana]|uniref:acyl carrier protein n=2 Tax=Salinispora mooreana TaxID=999545 RepID=UPI001CC3C726|nr:acyl carrier protein [Salinispora mooreana]
MRREGEMFDQLRQIMATKFQLDLAEITPESTLKDLELDSLDIVELGLVMNKELGVSLSDDELLEAQSLNAIVELAQARSARV